ncbi:MAG TPA: hypothetical protein VNT99_15520, partial [Methylomirabilota bacterium]|nr:hypothetical protein [Methylomirabilota bacterium]
MPTNPTIITRCQMVEVWPNPQNPKPRANLAARWSGGVIGLLTVDLRQLLNRNSVKPAFFFG